MYHFSRRLGMESSKNGFNLRVKNLYQRATFVGVAGNQAPPLDHIPVNKTWSMRETCSHSILRVCVPHLNFFPSFIGLRICCGISVFPWSEPTAVRQE